MKRYYHTLLLLFLLGCSSCTTVPKIPLNIVPATSSQDFDGIYRKNATKVWEYILWGTSSDSKARLFEQKLDAVCLKSIGDNVIQAQAYADGVLIDTVRIRGSMTSGGFIGKNRFSYQFVFQYGAITVGSERVSLWRIQLDETETLVARSYNFMGFFLGIPILGDAGQLNCTTTMERVNIENSPELKTAPEKLKQTH